MLSTLSIYLAMHMVPNTIWKDQDLSTTGCDPAFPLKIIFIFLGIGCG